MVAERGGRPGSQSQRAIWGGRMNLSAARTELAARGFDDLAAARLTLFLNQARNDFEDAYPFPWLETVFATGPAPLNGEGVSLGVRG